jgi:hypothetical protein
MATDAAAQKQRLDADFSALYKAHLRDVYSYAYYRVGNHHDAEDLTEQTFLQAYRHFERAQREAHDQRLAAVVRQLVDSLQDALEVVAVLDQRLRRVRGGDHAGVVDRGLWLARAVAVVVRREVVRDPDQPRPQRPAGRLALRALEVPVGLQERLLR